MAKYRAFISDFDGTLIGDDRKVSLKLKKAVQEYLGRGGMFVVASGRGFQGPIAEFYEEMGISGHAIVRAGAEIIEVSAKGQGRVIWEKFIPAHRVQLIIDYLIEHKFQMVAESGDHIYSPQALVELGFGRVEFKDISTINVNRVPKIVMLLRNHEKVVEPVLDYFSSAFPDIHPIKVAGPRGVGLDITAAGVSKHSALHRLSKIIGIGTEHMIGVGDSYNDFPLLSACGLKIAMGNAPNELKSIADHIVGSQAQDGVVDALEFAK